MYCRGFLTCMTEKQPLRIVTKIDSVVTHYNFSIRDWRETDNTTPICAISITREVPP